LETWWKKVIYENDSGSDVRQRVKDGLDLSRSAASFGKPRPLPSECTHIL
jgi:hypothetical protein